MARILMVCLGNICRSPLAEGILKSKLDLLVYHVDSAGTGAYHVGELPDPRSIAVASKNGIDIRDQRARQFRRSDFDSFNRIYVMDESNYRNVIKMARNAADIEKVKMILDELENPGIFEVPDPYYGGPDGFDKVFELLDEACDLIAKDLKYNQFNS